MAKKRKRAQAARKRPRGSRKPSQSKQAIPPWGMLVLGLGVGAVLTLLVLGASGYQKTGLGSGLKSLWQPRASISTSKPAAKQQPTPRPKVLSTQKFDFYEVLVESENLLPDEELLNDDDNTPAAGLTEKGVVFMLQAASYADRGEAESLKAKLALAGLRAHIQKVTVQKGRVYYRVRLGPFIDLGKLADSNEKLKKLGIRALRLKLTQSSPK